MSDSRYYSLKQLTKFPVKILRTKNVLNFVGSVLISMILVYFLRGSDFNHVQDGVMFILFLAIGLWITEAIPPFAVGILIIGFLVFTMGKEGNIDVKPYIQTWSDGVIWLFLGGFFLAAGMKKTNLDFQLLKIAAPRFGNKAQFVLLGLMMTTAVISMLMSNTATTAMMIATVTPLFTQLGKSSNFSKALLLGIPAAASIGGMGTIIGSAPNAIAVGALEGMGIKVSFIDWMLIGIPVSLALIFVFWKALTINYKIKNEVLALDFLSIKTEDMTIDSDEMKIQKRIMLIVLATTLFLWLTSKLTGIPVAAVSGVPIVALTMFGIIDADDVRSLSWDTLMLVAGGLALGLAIQEQGLATYFVSQISSNALNFNVLILVFGLVTVLLSNFMSNTAATTILIPVAITLSSVGTNNPIILPFVIGLSASCALLLPVSTPPNAIAYSTGYLTQSEFRLGGVVVGIAGPLLIILWTALMVFFFF
ncbi:MAG: SLC13 family permease [Flavobacterium sp.]